MSSKITFSLEEKDKTISMSFDADISLDDLLIRLHEFMTACGHEIHCIDFVCTDSKGFAAFKAHDGEDPF